MLDELYKDVEAAVSAGVTTRNDLLQITLKKNEVESNQINLVDNLALCKMVLAQHIGVETSSFEVASPETTHLPESPQSLYRDPAEALLLTQERRLLEKNVEANRLQHRLEIGKNLPTVGVGVGYMYNNLMDKDETFGVAFVSVSVPVSGWWGGSHKIKKQKLKVVNAENELSDKSELLVIKMQQTWNDLQNAWRQIRIAQSSIDRSAENLRLNRDCYQAGTVTMSDLLDAQTIYQQSKDNYVDAYAKYQVKVLEYMQSTGR